MLARWGARISFWILIVVVKCLPYRLFHLLAAPLVGAAFLWSKRLHRNALESLDIAYGDQLSLIEKKRIAKESFFSLTWGLVDLLYYAARPKASARRFEIEGLEHLKRAHKAGKGTVLAIAHVGPFAAMLFKFLCEGFPVFVVMRKPRSAVWQHELKAHDDFQAPKLIYSVPLRRCVAECFKVLESNAILAMPIDQNYGGVGRVFVDFFGRKAATASGPAGYAVKTGAALLTAFARPVAPGRWKIIISPVTWKADVDERVLVRQLTQKMTSRVEAEARKHPGEWSWMHRRWKAVPKENE